MRTAVPATTALLILLVLPLQLFAHHGAFYKTVFRAIENADPGRIRELFSDSAWEGKQGAMSALELQERLKKGKVTQLREFSSYGKTRSEECLVHLKLEHPDHQDRQHIFLLAKRLGDDGNRSPKAWQIVRIVDDVREAQLFLGRQFDSAIRPPIRLPVGRWSVGFANGVTQTCVIRKDGTTSVVEPRRASSGKAAVKDGSVVIVYDDDRVERWTSVGQRLVVEHWYPAAQFPSGAAVLGIADRSQPVEVTALDEAKSLTLDIASVFVHYRFELQPDQFTTIMKTLAGNPRIRHLRLHLPNSAHVKDETLDVLREFQSLETLELIDARDWEAPSIFEQVAAMRNLKQAKFSFL